MEASRIKLDLTGSDGVQMQATHSSNDYFAESGNEFFGIASAQNSLEALKRYLGSSDYLDESESKLAESYLRMSDFSVPLTDIEEFGGTYRARNLNGEDFNQVLQDYGNNGQSFIFRAEILLVCNGRLKDGGDGTVVIFRFTFSTAENVSQRRFTSAKITVEFSDFLGRPANDPEVVTLFPERLHNLDIVTNSSVKGQQANAATGTSEPARLRFGAGLKLSQTDSDVYYARLMPVTWNTRPKKSGQDNAALWRLKEHTSKENGVPDFLQTAVILRRNGDGKFRMKIKIEATVDNRIDMKPTIEKMFGEIELGPVDPVNINPASFLGKEIDIPWLVGGILDALDLDIKGSEKQKKKRDAK
ncbi:uncharacterized protein TRIVIDRAFT_223463 [Trichoderma virens Gv29-8]|uniref:Uncharacterized protein n=1 Tax=Hypocrea virens (strain Gv29-8 / FGSC 10586) TaxID=413071 RepID=G9MX64_HYPVG|nr:uncharacterized protein TRIVIDRAFT_223463 [Trichoderma virens Gv29-8]EHK20997.1 hypothetical protein TRIVIDRAFT_223463 [Trichoderma virens Gv29-8]